MNRIRYLYFLIFQILNFVSESQVAKPLLWDTVRLEERFSFVNFSKLVHVVADDRINDDWKLYEW